MKKILVTLLAAAVLAGCQSPHTYIPGILQVNDTDSYSVTVPPSYSTIDVTVDGTSQGQATNIPAVSTPGQPAPLYVPLEEGSHTLTTVHTMIVLGVPGTPVITSQQIEIVSGQNGPVVDF